MVEASNNKKNSENSGNSGSNDSNKNNENDELLRASFTDAELNNALAGFEREFQENNNSAKVDSENLKNSYENKENPSVNNSLIDEAMRNIEEANFEEDLQELIGNKAKVALMITYVQPMKLLSAFCKMADVSAKCFDEENGSVAVLKKLDGNEPEEAVQKFVDFFRGMDVMLITNRADKLTAKVYEYNTEPQEIVAPMALAVWSRAVEDLAICMTNVNALEKQDIEICDSDDLNDVQAYQIFQKYGKRN